MVLVSRDTSGPVFAVHTRVLHSAAGILRSPCLPPLPRFSPASPPPTIQWTSSTAFLTIMIFVSYVLGAECRRRRRCPTCPISIQSLQGCRSRHLLSRRPVYPALALRDNQGEAKQRGRGTYEGMGAGMTCHVRHACMFWLDSADDVPEHNHIVSLLRSVAFEVHGY